MNIVYREDKRDGQIKGFMSPHQNCENCGKAIEPIFKASRIAEDWFWRECDTCQEFFCDDCSTVEADGTTECNMCYGDRVRRAR